MMRRVLAFDFRLVDDVDESEANPRTASNRDPFISANSA